MPEGDVVWRTARRLNAALAGRTLTVCDLRWPSLATVDLSGRDVVEVVSAGKHILARVAAGPTTPPVTLHSHLRMEGSWHVHRTGERWGPGPGGSRYGAGAARDQHGIRAIVGNAEWTAVGHKLGMLDLVATSEEGRLVGHLGPDVLGPGWDAAEATRRLAAAPSRRIGEALLDQRVLAGVGTFFMCEVLFLKGVTPWTAVQDAGDPAAVVDLVHLMLDQNKERAVQSTTGDARQGRQQWVHARSGRPCRRCGTTIRVASIGTAPSDRVAFWCPRCQAGPAPTDDGRPQRPLGAGRRAGRPRS